METVQAMQGVVDEDEAGEVPEMTDSTQWGPWRAYWLC